MLLYWTPILWGKAARSSCQRWCATFRDLSSLPDEPPYKSVKDMRRRCERGRARTLAVRRSWRIMPSPAALLASPRDEFRRTSRFAPRRFIGAWWARYTLSSQLSNGFFDDTAKKILYAALWTLRPLNSYRHIWTTRRGHRSISYLHYERNSYRFWDAAPLRIFLMFQSRKSVDILLTSC